MPKAGARPRLRPHRNAAARSIHGYLGRDGLAPREFLRSAREGVARYGVEVLHLEAVNARSLPPPEGQGPWDAFEVEAADGRRFSARKLLLATGVRDILPGIEGAEAFYGRGVHHCPYCDGWEYRGRSLVAFGAGKAAVGLALSLRT